MDESAPHTPVLLDHVLWCFRDLGEGVLVDGTLGAGGHARALLEAHPRLRLLGIDRDPDALELAAETLRDFQERTRFENARYSEFATLLKPEEEIAGLLLDVGVSSMQLDQPERGFSFDSDAPLDLRMEQSGETALDLIDRLTSEELADVLFHNGGERLSRRISQWMKNARDGNELETCRDLGELCRRAYPRKHHRIHPATRTFQALRIVVNDELGELQRALQAAAAFRSLVVTVISFHSLEDRIVKNQFREWKQEGRGVLLTKKPLVADDEEVRTNRRARSAKVRAFHFNAGDGAEP